MTLLWVTFKLAIRNIWAHKMRSVLTMLGIIIGVASVIIMMALGNGAKEAALGEFRSMAGVDSLYVVALYRGTSQNYHRLNLDDCRSIMREVPEVEGLSPLIESAPQLKVGNRHTRGSLVGVALPYFNIQKYELSAGRIFTPLEEERPRKLAIIGNKIVENLYGGDPAWAIGREIKVDNESYTVIGTMARKGGLGGSDADNRIIVPYTTAMKRISGRTDFWTIAIQMRDEDSVAAAIPKIEDLLRRRHRIPEGTENDFRIIDPADALASIASVIGVFTVFIASIAGISLLVGGIGIMNIMLVTVTERTHEIGVRKALGAKRRDILRQFLLEALVISLIGGGLGTTFGGILTLGFNFAVTRIPNAPQNFTAAISPFSVLISFAFCLLIGLFFGIYPARKAARLNPIEALRYE